MGYVWLYQDAHVIHLCNVISMKGAAVSHQAGKNIEALKADVFESILLKPMHTIVLDILYLKNNITMLRRC